MQWNLGAQRRLAGPRPPRRRPDRSAGRRRGEPRAATGGGSAAPARRASCRSAALRRRRIPAALLGPADPPGRSVSPRRSCRSPPGEAPAGRQRGRGIGRASTAGASWAGAGCAFFALIGGSDRCYRWLGESAGSAMLSSSRKERESGAELSIPGQLPQPK
jgi:hypothetical protein